MTTLLTLVLLCVAAGVGAVIVHEAGHAVAALLVGGRDVRLVRDDFGFAVHAELPPDAPAWRRVCFYGGGIAANVVVAATGAIVGGAGGAALVGMNLLFAVVQARGAGSDGAQGAAALESARSARSGEVR